MLINKNTFSNKLLNKYIYWSGIITLLFILITFVNYNFTITNLFTTPKNGRK